MTNALKQSGAYLEIVSFHLGDQEFCIDIMAIREIRGWAPVTPMPHTPPYVLGLINLRGAVIPVIDMAARLGMKMTEPSERSAIIVTDIAGKLVGLLVEQVSDMMTIKSEALQPAPEIIPEAQRAFCRGIVALEKTMVCFLNLDTVIADELAQAAKDQSTHAYQTPRWDCHRGVRRSGRIVLCRFVKLGNALSS